jgi:integrase
MGRSRADKVIWNTVKIVGARAGVEATTHALRAAFAVQFDEEHPDQLIALKELMGHARIETTLVYLRRKDKAKAMETVRSLSWGRFVFPPSEEAAYRKPRKSGASLEEAHTGFEPVLPP